jgi:CRISPR-associated protein Csm1
MIVLGDISGIQNYVFDVTEEGGGQARRLRARSFFVQLLAEAAALRVRRALDWGTETVLLCGAGKFTLRGTYAGQAEGLLIAEQQAINEWLQRETRGELRLTLAWSDSADSDLSVYQAAQQQLQRKKAQPWAPTSGGNWADSRLILDPLDTPCNLCHHAPATEEEIDADGTERRVCRTCTMNREVGQKLPRARWLIIRERPEAADLTILGLGIDVITDDFATIGPEVLAVANLQYPESCPPWCPRELFMQRRLMAHIPVDDDGQPIWFTELAEQFSQGAPQLAVLKADADSLGVLFERLLNSGDLNATRQLSDRLDEFFASRLRRELANRNSRWWPIYTIFAGGDDLVMVGPWNVMVDFAAEMQRWFKQQFPELTLSAGLELIKPKRPIKAAVERAELLLNEAKDQGKDRLAAFGQVWPWNDHDTIISTAKQLVDWTNAGDIQRGWLHTLLELVLARHGDRPEPLATARLTYHVSRNWKKDTPAWQWANRLIHDFDDREQIQVRYLPAIVRYALTATRTRGEED